MSEEDDAGDIYAREVVEAIAAIRRQLVDLEDLDDRVAVVGPDDAFVEWLREPLARGLDGSFELVDAATASAALLAARPKRATGRGLARRRQRREHGRFGTTCCDLCRAGPGY